MRVAIALLGFTLIFASASAEPAAFDAERFWQMQRIGPPAIAADGKRIVAAVTKFDLENDRASTDLWLWSTDGKVQRPLTSHPAAESSPRFSPDGKYIAFVAEREGDGAPQLYVLPVDGGEATRVTQVPTGVDHPVWFKDGRHLAFVSRVWVDLDRLDQQAQRLEQRRQSKSSARAWDGGPVLLWDDFVDDRQLHVFRVDLEGSAPVNLTRNSGLQLPRHELPTDGPLYDRSPDGREIVFVADSDPAANRVNYDIFALAIGSSQARNLSANNPANDTVPQYSPDGRYLAFFQQRIPGFYYDNRRLMLHERRLGTTRQAIAEDWDRAADGLVWSADSKRLYGSIEDAGHLRVYELTVDGKARRVTSDSSFTALAIAQDRGTLVGLRHSFIEPPTLVRIDPQNGAAAQIDRINDDWLAGTEMGSFESVTYPGANGVGIQMWVNYPPNFDRSKSYSLLMLLHGGPHDAIPNGMRFRWNAQVFASWGYVVAWPNFHGSSGFGNAFADSINPRQDDLPYRDVVAATEWLST